MNVVFDKTQLLRWWLPSFAAVSCFVAGIVMDEKILLIIPFVGLAVVFFTADVKKLFFFLLFFIPLSTEFEVTATLSTDLPDEPLMLMLSGSILVLLILKPSLLPAEVKKSSLFMLLALQFMWLIAVIIFSYDQLLSIKYLLAKVWYVFAFVLGTLLFLQKKEDYILASKALIVGMLITVVNSLLRHSFKGFTFEAINETLSPFFRNHVNYSAVLVCLFPVLFMWRHFTKGNKQKAVTALIFLFAVALFFAYSRGAWLCIVSGAVTWIAVKKRFLLSLLAFTVLASLISLYVLVQNDRYLDFAPDFNKTTQHFDFSEHMEATYKLKDVSTMERVYRWVAGFKMINEEKLTGFGPNNFSSNYKNYTVAAFKTWVSANEDKSSVHNYFLLVTIEQGIPGLIIFCLLLFVMFVTALKGYHVLQDPFYKQLSMLCAVILSMILTLNLLSDLVETDKIGSLYFIVLALLMQVQLQIQQQKKNAAL